MKYKLLRAVSIIGLAVSCTRKDSKELNTIILKDPVINVQDSILRLNDLLVRLPITLNGDFRNYEFANNSDLIQPDIKQDTVLYINGNKINEQTIDTAKVLANYTSEEKNHMIALAAYLKDNYLWGAGFGSDGIDMWSYDYRGGCEHGFQDCRTIIALKNLSDTLQIMYGSFDKIIDRKGKLILCAPKEAKIY